MDSYSGSDEARSHDHDPRDETQSDEAERQALIEHARKLGATADELQVALDALAVQAEAVLHRLRGGRLH